MSISAFSDSMVLDSKTYLLSTIPGDQLEVRKCVVPSLINYQIKLVGDDLELMTIAESLLIQKEMFHNIEKQPSTLYLSIS